MDLYTDILHLFWRIASAIDYAFEGTYTERVLAAAWELFSDLWYFVVLGAVVASLLSCFLPREKLSGFLSKRARSALILSCLIGVASPMPTFAGIPLVAALLTVGVPPAPLIAFLVASPLMNPSLFILTAGAMGLKMALARTFSAFVLGISAGAAVDLLVKTGVINPVSRSVSRLNGLNRLSQKGSCSSCGQPMGQLIERIEPMGSSSRRQPISSPDNDPTLWQSVYESHTDPHGQVKLFWREFRRLTIFIGKYFLLAIFFAGLVQVLIPPSWVVSLVGSQNRFSILVAVAMGIPLYACGGGSIPVIEILTRMGMSQGAALAFFISGPATKFSTILTLYAALKAKILVLYLAITLLGAAILGYGYSLVF